LEKDECKLGEFDKSRDKARQKVTKCQLKCEDLNATLDYIVVEKYKAMVATIVANLKKRERDSTTLEDLLHLQSLELGSKSTSNSISRFGI